uniref:Choline kinase N-terminal domain-containing protein n=1 Tax=Glycine max TaxID=3847 RepID=A0A368UJW5_SOYBN
MGATEEALQNLVNVNVVDAENPKNIKVSGTEDSVVNDKELGAKETPIKDKKDSIPGEVKEMLKSLASEWENVVDINALQVIPLKGAMTNEVFQIKWQTTAGESSRKVLLRTYGEGTGIFFDRDVETLSASDLRDPSISALIAAKLKEFHDLDMPGPKTVNLWDRLRNWLSEAKRLCSPEEAEAFHLDTMDKEISALENFLSDTHQRIGFCHNDLQYGNIMFDEESSSVTIIDYEYANYNPVAYDIANHFNEMAANYHTDTPHVLDFTKYPDLEERRRFAHAYLSSSGEQPSDTEEHVNKIDFDYKEYAKQRLQEYWSRKTCLLGSHEYSSHDNATKGSKH